MNSSGPVVDLIVTGVRTVANECRRGQLTKVDNSPKCRRKLRIKCLKRNPQQVAAAKDKSTVQTESSLPLWETESSNESASLYQGAGPNPATSVIWVDIAKKLATPCLLTGGRDSSWSLTSKTPKSQRMPKTPKASPNLDSASQNSLPDAFQKFIQKSLQLIAEVEMAKQRRSLNRQLSLLHEDNVNWTSNAPRPSQQNKPSQPSHKKRRKKGHPTVRLNDVVQGIHLEREARQSTSTTRARLRFKKAKRSDKTKRRSTQENLHKKVMFRWFAISLRPTLLNGQQIGSKCSPFWQNKRILRQSKSRSQLQRNAGSIADGNIYGGYETECDLPDSAMHQDDYNESFSSRMNAEVKFTIRSSSFLCVINSFF